MLKYGKLMVLAGARLQVIFLLYDLLLCRFVLGGANNGKGHPATPLIVYMPPS